MDDRIFTKRFFLVFLAQFATAMVMYTLMSTITEYAANMGTTATIAGLVSGIYVFGGLCSRLYAGRAQETVGWKKLAIIFLIIHSVACIFYFFVDNIWLLLLVRFIHGIGFGAGGNAIMTIGVSILPYKRFSEACGYFMMSTTLAVGLGPFFGGFIYDNLSSNGCFAMSVILCFLSLICVAVLDIKDVDPAVQRKNNQSEIIKPQSEEKGINKFLEVKAVPIAVVTALSALGYVAVMSFYRLYAVETELTDIFSKFFLIYAVVLLFSRPMAGKLQDKYGDKIVCYPGIIIQSIGLLLLALFPCGVTVVFCAIACGLGYGTLNSACNAIACRSTSLARRSYAVCAFYICCDVAMGIGPAILGFIVTSIGGYQQMYVAAAAFTLLALPICIKTLNKNC